MGNTLLTLILSDNKHELSDYKMDIFFDTIFCQFYAPVRLQEIFSNTPENIPNPKGVRTFFKRARV